MSPVTPKSPKAGDYKDEFVERTVTLRGREYTFRELDVSKYDELYAQATSQNENGDDMLDNGLLSKLMTCATVIHPRLPDGLSGMPMRLANKLSSLAREVNYGLEPEEGEKKAEPDIQEGEPEDEGEG